MTAARTGFQPFVAPSEPLMRTRRTRSICVTEFMLPRDFTVPEHDHTPPHLLVMFGGELVESYGDSQLYATGSLRYSPGSDRHVVHTLASGAHLLVLEAFGFPELRLTRRVHLSAPDVAARTAAVRKLLLDDGEASPVDVEEAGLALFAMIRDRSRDIRVRRHRWVSEIKRRLDLRDPSRAPLRDAASAVRRSSGLVARAFRAQYGVSIDWYRRRRQIDRAWRLLGDGRRTLSDVAATAGFADQSHMTRTFAREIGDTPARLRERMRQGEGTRHWFRATPLHPINGRGTT